MDRTTWLDGLRGIAAAIVALDHYFMGGVLDVAFRSFWADPPEDNRRFIQLPPIRLLFASHAMVPLFLVISGYAISINLLRARNNSSVSSAAAAAAAASCEGDFVRRLSSAATRRIFRIYLPVVAIASISQLLYFCNLYRWDFGDEVVWGRRPWTAPWLHVTFLTRYILDIMNIIQFHNNPGLNGQLWTMPFEFRGSCIVYLTILALAFWRPSFRRWALVGMMAYFFHYGLWDIFAFLAGLYLAEMKLASGETQSAELKLLPDYRRTCSSLAAAWKTRIKSFNLARIRTVISFAFGFHLICLSDDGYLPPGYQFLARFQSSRWDDDWAVLSKCWKAAGAVLLVYAIDKSSSLQRALNVRAVQYLGRISFSLYLVHQSVYHLARDPVRDFIWWILTRSPYSSTEEASRTAIVPFGLAWIGGFLVMGAVVVYLADLYTRNRDSDKGCYVKLTLPWNPAEDSLVMKRRSLACRVPDPVQGQGYRLYASIYTENVFRALKFVKAVAAGNVSVNVTSPWMTHDMPFRGWKQSSYGREPGKYSVTKWMELKTAAAVDPC